MGIDNHTSESIHHLVQLHKYLNNDCVHEAGKDWLAGEIASLKEDLGLEPIQALDRFEQPMSWERNGRIIHEDEMADYKDQEVERMIERSGDSLDEHYNKTEKGECEYGNS